MEARVGEHKVEHSGSARDQVGHGEDLGVHAVRFRLLRVERLDGALHEHIRDHQVLEARGPPARTHAT